MYLLPFIKSKYPPGSITSCTLLILMEGQVLNLSHTSIFRKRMDLISVGYSQIHLGAKFSSHVTLEA